MNKQRFKFNLFSIHVKQSSKYFFFNLAIFNISWISGDVSLFEFYWDEESGLWFIEILFSSLLTDLLENKWRK
ncbi:MAG: hypothetical protein HOG49_07355 [Candidatus Scalindua sp.]|nr:hypothetical protein [Candidatus Scalindua sp.]